VKKGIVSKICLGGGRCGLFRWTNGRKALTTGVPWRMGWLTNSDCDERGADGPSLVVFEGVGGRTWTEVDMELEGSGIVGGLARAKITPEGGAST
jgi:hypothetical protein